jgi:hypothetical protein
MNTKAREQAKHGLALIQHSILEVLRSSPSGLSNAEIADLLDLHSTYLGGQKDYLSWSILGLLLNETKIRRVGRQYFAN